MELSTESEAAHWAALAQRAGAAPGTDALRAELLRTELAALGEAPRRWLVERVAARCGEGSADAVRAVLQRLEAQGDVCAGPGGVVAAAPLRLVQIREGRWLALGTVPTERLETALQVDVARAVLRRGSGSYLQAGVAALQGCVVTLERYTGLLREAAADAGWLAALAERSRGAEEVSAGFTPTWDACQRYLSLAEVPEQRRRWRSSNGMEGLVRARQAGGFWAHALWGQDRHGTPRRLLLRGDEALRTQFALDRQAGAPLQLQAVRGAGGYELVLDARLPVAEYRCVLACCERIESGATGAAPRGWLREEDLPGLSRLLQERLGIVIAVERERQIGAAGSGETQ